MSTPDVDQLRDLAHKCGVVLNRPDAAAMIRRRELAGAESHVAGVGALMAKASAVYGWDLSQENAARRLDRADGNYDVADQVMCAQLEHREARERTLAFRRLERRHFERDARQRHALFVGHLSGKRLGYQAVMLITAAEDAQLVQPNARELRRSLQTLVGEELDRLYPTRNVVEVEQGTRAHELASRADEDERAVRGQVLADRRALEQRIDLLASDRRARKRVIDRLRQVRKALEQRVESGAWMPDPDRYRREVLEPMWTEGLHNARIAS